LFKGIISYYKGLFNLCRVLRPTAKDTINLLENLPKKARRSITYDNGGEFSTHGLLQQHLDMQTFFCAPYSSWQKSGVDNSNGRLRRDFPRKTNVKNMPKEDFDEVIENYNSTPRKNLNWLTPAEAFYKNLKGVAIQT
jgi:transposase, IS30 family